LFVAAIALALGLPAVASAAPNAAAAPPTSSSSAAGSYQPVAPVRVVDSRVGQGLSGALGDGVTGSFNVLGVGGVPPTGVSSVALNVTIVNPSADTDLSVWAHGAPMPSTSNVNATTGSTAANFVITAPGADGAVAIRNQSGHTDVVVDVLGWFDGDTGGRVHSMTSSRLVDTRTGQGAAGPIGAVSVSFDVSGQGGVPATGISSVLLNVTGVSPTEATHLSVWPNGISPPATSNLNLAAGAVTANLVLVSPGTDGRVRLANNAGLINVVVDVVGYVTVGQGGGGQVAALQPARLVDSRLGTGIPGHLGAGETAEFTVAPAGGVPASSVAAVVLNVTGVDATGPTHLTVGPSGVSLPATSNVNVGSSAGVANAVLVTVGVGGKVAIRNNDATIDVVVDVEAFVSAGVTIGDPVAANADRCDPLDPSLCLLPFPNDWFTTPDPSSDTGRRVHMDASSTPANVGGVHIDPTEWNHNDGFSPGQALMVHVPGLDPAASGLPPVTDIGSSLNANASVFVIDTATGERYPVWAELDSHATTDANRMLIIQPAKALTEGHHFVVGLRNLATSAHQPIAPTDTFRALRDDLVTNVASIESRRGHFDELFDVLRRAGVETGQLDLAWDFTVASGHNESERMLHIRDDSFSGLGSAAPHFEVTNVEQNVDAKIARRITGTFSVPNYMTGDGSAGQRFNLGPNGLPAQNGMYTAVFQCNVGYATTGPGGGSAPGPVTAARPVVYGHGLLGDESEIDAGNVGDMTNGHNMVYCATRWIGLSEEDVVNAIHVLADLSLFPTVADRLQQGILNTLWLGRLMRTAPGFSSDPAFQGPQGQPLMDTSELYYDGNSQGGIMGGAATAVSQEWTRAVLGVPAMDYAVLLPRSHDFEEFTPFLNGAYTNELDRPLVLDMIQMLWDRGEAAGYAQHLTTDPYPGTPVHTVLLHEAFGDFQVPNVGTEIEARTIGASVHQPALAPNRSTDVTPFWGIPAIPSYPFNGSALVMWDSGTPAPPIANLPPSVGNDPHSRPRSTTIAQQQKSVFLQPNGTVIDVCSNAPCAATP